MTKKLYISDPIRGKQKEEIPDKWVCECGAEYNPRESTERKLCSDCIRQITGAY